MTSDCISDDTLALFATGKLAAAERPVVESHLDSCVVCRRGVAALAAVGSSRVARSFVDGQVLPVDAAPDDTFAAGQRIGRYVVTRPLGAGGMGVVVAAHDPELDRRVAIKLVSSRLWQSASTDTRELLRQEARAMARIVHPNVVAVHDLGTVGDQLFVAMELVAGCPLDEWANQQPRAWRDLLRVCCEAGRGLAAVHAAGLVHRDVKPSNVMVDASGRARIADFGLAVLVAGERGVEAIGGTPAYMSPEQHTTFAVGPASDQFSFCVMVYEALYGSRPFVGTSHAIVGPPRMPPSSPVPTSVRRALFRGLAVKPEQRFASMDALLEALQPRTMRRATAVIAAAAAVAVIAAVAITRSEATTVDGCAPGEARFAEAWSPVIARDVAAHVRESGEAQPAEVSALLDERARGWLVVHRESCHAAGRDPKVGATVACLESRRLELAAVSADLRVRERPAKDALLIVRRLVRDPAACRVPPPGLAGALVPVDPRLRAAVVDFEYRLQAVREGYEREPTPAIVEAARSLVGEAERIAWTPSEAEANFVLGMPALIFDEKAGIAALTRAATLAEEANHDRLAAEAWLELATVLSTDHGELDRPLVYVQNASSASARLGRPPDLEAKIAFTRGRAYVFNDDTVHGYADIETALAFAEQAGREPLDEILLSLATDDVPRKEEHLADSAAFFRRILDREVATNGPGRMHEVPYRAGLAMTLSMMGDHAAAISEALRALEIANRTMSADATGRVEVFFTLMNVYYFAGKFSDALAIVERTKPLVIARVGRHGERYGALLEIEGAVLVELGRLKDALTTMNDACEIAAFTNGESSPAYAICMLETAPTLLALGRAREARDRILANLPAVAAALGNGAVLGGYADLGEAYLLLHDRAKAIGAFEEARRLGTDAKSAFERGNVGNAEWGLARTIERDDPLRARTLVADALERWGTQAFWASSREEAVAWLAKRRIR